jgi:serine/threonine protein kinase/Tol biopolymer transport system component
MSMIGKTIAHYSITAEIGKGGMGEVYQATDTKLGRSVAIKVLPEEFAKDADRIARFQREAKLLASLNHPNIAAIYGLEKSDGTHFLVMELIEGDTLAERIKVGAIPVEESLKLALQIAEGLEAAHEKGVIHRDLKPANIKVTPDGKVKVLDFGLAKAFAGEQVDLNLSNSPTLSVAATQQGVILGTAAYMSPEQARGKEVDKRADIWAFGVVLFEMLTGQSLFSGEDVSSTLARVLEREPDFSTLSPNLHPRIRLLLERCLEKNAKDRCHDIADVRVDIQKVLSDPGGVFAQPVSTVESRINLRSIISWVAAAVILTAIIVGAVIWKLRAPVPRQVMRSEYALQEDQQLTGLPYNVVSVSPDGMSIVYAANTKLYLKKAEDLIATPIEGTDEDPVNLFFSPDGQYVGYESRIDGHLKKIAITGGVPMRLCDVVNPNGATWGKDGWIIFSAQGGILRVSGKGGNPEQIIKKVDDAVLLYPQILPDKETILFTAYRPNNSQVAIQSLKSEERVELFEGNYARYIPTGHIIYTLENKLYAQSFDLETLKVSGASVPLEKDIFQNSTEMPGQFAISDSGTLVYIAGTTSPTTLSTLKMNLVWVDQTGKVEEIAAPPNNYVNPRISPDGKKVAVTVYAEEGSSDIYIMDINGETPSRLTFNENSTDPLWTLDSQWIVFVSGNGDKRGIYQKKADHTGKEELIALSSDGGGPPWSWADNGKTLVTTKSPLKSGGIRSASPAMIRRRMMSGGRGRGPAPKQSPVTKRAQGSERSSTSEETEISTDIGTLSMEGEHKWQSLLNLKGFVLDLQISPDGRWMAYSFPEPGGVAVNVHPFPDVDDGKWQFPGGGLIGFLWSPYGHELFYSNIEDGSLGAVEVETEPTFKFGKPEVLFNTRGMGVGLSGIASIFPGSFDISQDGKRFLMLKEAATIDNESQAKEAPAERPRKIIIVTNWFEELKEKVPLD